MKVTSILGYVLCHSVNDGDCVTLSEFYEPPFRSHLQKAELNLINDNKVCLMVACRFIYHRPLLLFVAKTISISYRNENANKFRSRQLTEQTESHSSSPVVSLKKIVLGLAHS